VAPLFSARHQQCSQARFTFWNVLESERFDDSLGVTPRSGAGIFIPEQVC
jgi:hypothetical protein